MTLQLFLNAIQPTSNGATIHLTSVGKIHGHNLVFLKGGPFILEMSMRWNSLEEREMPCIELDVAGMMEEEGGITLLFHKNNDEDVPDEEQEIAKYAHSIIGQFPDLIEEFDRLKRQEDEKPYGEVTNVSTALELVNLKKECDRLDVDYWLMKKFYGFKA